LPAHFHHRASYLHLLRLDRFELEAEFRRRGLQSVARPASSPDVRTCQVAVKTAGGSREFAVRVIAHEPLEDLATHQQFDLWKIDARRALEHRGSGLRLEINHGQRALNVDLPASISHGDRIGFVIPCGKHFRQGMRAAAQANAALIGKPSALGCVWRPPPQQLVLMRALIALDAHLAGASYRQIAEAVFGGRAVRERWGSVSTLKEQTRYLVRKARSLMNRPAIAV
jgi:hypothetical protein